MTLPGSFSLTNVTAVQTLVVSEVLPLAYFKISLPMSPAEGEEVRVDCSSVVSATGLQITPPSVSFHGPAAVLSHAFSVLPMNGVKQNLSNASLDASYFAPRFGSIRCTVRSHASLISGSSGLDIVPQYAQYAVISWDATGDPTLSISVPFVWLPAKLPMIEDAIVEVAGDGLRSA
jgi:hypothetical protein